MAMARFMRRLCRARGGTLPAPDRATSTCGGTRHARRHIAHARGSMTLEAALILPFVAMAAMAFIFCMRLILAEIALQQAVSQTVRIVSAHLYPLALVQQSDAGRRVEGALTQAGEWIERVEEAAKRLEAYEAYLPGNLSRWLAESAAWLKRSADQAGDRALGAVFLPLLQERLGHTPWVDPDAVRITDVTFPNLGDRADAYFGLRAVYTVTIRLPFYRTAVEIEVEAYERVWLAG
jgi:hypothetical protein